MPPTTQNVMKFEELIGQLSDIIKRAKVQTGELSETRNKLDEVDRALRGTVGESGLIARMERLHDRLNPLIDKQIPEMLKSIEVAIRASGAATTEMQQCRLHHDAELGKLRQEFESHIKSEEKEEAKFGGREWFRENASALLVSAITLLVNAAVTALIISRFLPPNP